RKLAPHFFVKCSGARVRNESSGALIKNRNLRKGSIQILRHGSRAAFENGFQGFTAGDRQTDCSSKSRETCLFERSCPRGAVALDCVPDAALKRADPELAFDKVIRCPGSHGFEIDLVLAHSGKEDDGQLATTFQRGAQ